MKAVILTLIPLSIILQGCNEEKAANTFSNGIDTGTDLVDTTIIHADSTEQKDTIPTKVPAPNNDTETVIKPTTKDQMPVAKPDSLKKKEQH